MEKTYTLKACCALCEYLWDENNCPLFKTFEAARNIGDYTYDNDIRFRMICDEFEVNSKLQQVWEHGYCVGGGGNHVTT